jgi:2-amino-4-hydroxy-6-hydroxymethyldihydropteridine diphosphokinase
MGAKAYIAIGSNLAEPLKQVIAAWDEIAKLPKSELIQKSSLYVSKPLGYKDQPDFINAVVLLDTELSPHELLSELQSVEILHERVRSFPNAPRTLDLDIILFGNLEINDPQLVIPHPRMHERAFVIFPLQEINPNISIPHIGDIAKIAKGLDPKSAKRITL